MSAASELNCGYVRAKVKVSELLSSGHRTEGLYGREKGAHNVDMHGKKKKSHVERDCRGENMGYKL